MKTVILAGGLGTRLSEETVLRPKPMVEIGGRPILWHIMKIYASQGFNDFVVCLGYKGYLIKEYFANYFLHQSDVTIDLGKNSLQVHNTQAEDWRVTLIDTGDQSMTGARIKKAAPYLDGQPFMLTYGDGVGNIDLHQLLAAHQQGGRFCTVTAVQPSGRFGSLDIDGKGGVSAFQEKPKGDGAWINGGFFVCQPEVLNYLTTDNQCIWERQPLEQLARDGQLTAHRHQGYWKPMDTLRDKDELEKEWATGHAPWKIW
ncbi:MAG: glucose-1-phosphate cytidylyltransferase [Bacteroidetes bacterium]|nr:glucose-1-phosphate cytidylyltransferase [Bacteroidota bacterium]